MLKESHKPSWIHFYFPIYGVLIVISCHILLGAVDTYCFPQAAATTAPKSFCPLIDCFLLIDAAMSQYRGFLLCFAASGRVFILFSYFIFLIADLRGGEDAANVPKLHRATAGGGGAANRGTMISKIVKIDLCFETKHTLTLWILPEQAHVGILK